MPSIHLRILKYGLAAAVLALAGRASALQPLESFLRGARDASPDNAEARAARAQASAGTQAALGRALPGVSLLGTYTRNQYETRIPSASGPVVITPRDQLDGYATVHVPLVDLSTFARIGAARAASGAAAEQQDATELRVQSLVSREYHQLVASKALVEASRRALDVSRAGLRIAEARHGAGSTALLDVDRARAEVERNVQQLATAELQVSLAARALRSLSGLEPELEGEVALGDDLHEEPPIESFQAKDDEVPAIASAMRARVAEEREAWARRLVLVPSLSASATEHVTDYTGLAGHERTWQAVVSLTWSFDLTTLANIRAQDAVADGARAREERARLAAHDDVHTAWMTVRTDIARSRSARVQAEVSQRAAGLALERYQAGAADQLDLLQAQRDAFNADAARIQADAEVSDARAQLRLAAGRNLLDARAGPQASPQLSR
ncbi:TolC family protein [Anaeromyxobacter dehalogenans]|uniref:Outer membrane efflux protein n=1 Tax=Anaeromyxobacter dehalogenans (strain 2CP-C) TaxID=290397 RepID=Q2IK31_ANADE|nr:TolC family protein [Anaeromyxobacter dehalogenans]ABC82008.1 outer membrane efflux protein [Anaeromyxobacter dehalogenans 2CP-C]